MRDNAELELKLIDRLKTDVLPGLAPEMIALSDRMALNPETGGQEFESSKMIVELLRKAGIETEYPFCDMPTAFRARINPGREPRCALLAEYDALRGFGHACGHCASGSASLMAALALNSVKDELDFGVDLIGTPDEEILGCKATMADKHVFDGYAFAAMVHMAAENMAVSNFIALDAMTIEFFGQAAHAAAQPEKGRNALNAARLFFDAIDMMRQHIPQSARLHGYIIEGGKASNIVPDYSSIEFLSRAPQRAQLNGITEWVRDCVKAAALATHTEYKMSPLGEPFHDLYISPSGGKLLAGIFSDMGLEYTNPGEGGSGSSDIGNVDYICPAFHPNMGIGKGLCPHTAPFAAAMTGEGAHTAIIRSAEYLIRLCFALFFHPDTLKRITDEHDAYRGAANAQTGA